MKDQEAVSRSSEVKKDKKRKEEEVLLQASTEAIVFALMNKMLNSYEGPTVVATTRDVAEHYVAARELVMGSDVKTALKKISFR